jgi:hypothetical protein
MLEERWPRLAKRRITAAAIGGELTRIRALLEVKAAAAPETVEA